MRILAINPGSTSTKIAVFNDLEQIFTKTLRHSVEELAAFASTIEQYEFRKEIIINALKEENITPDSLDAIVGRGGLLKPIPGGVYKVNDKMLEDLKGSARGEHASNLGGIIAIEIVKSLKKDIPAFIVDPVVVDELQDLARLSGHPLLPRVSIFHALNQKAVAHRFAREIGKKYQELNLIVVHLGGGISVGAHSCGKVIDVNNALDGDGPYSPERSGDVPARQLAELCFSGKFTYDEVRKMITGKGGMVAYLNTNDAYQVELKAVAGDPEFKKIYEGIAYQISKEIGGIATVLKGKIDSIIITGGLANSAPIVEWITERVSFLAPIKVYPGEDEMQALSESVFYAIKGEEEIKEYK
jgi:butyrate kinase